MEYIEKATKEIKEDWFEDHVIKEYKGKEGFQRISFGEKGTRMYQVDYVLSGNTIFVTGDLGEAVYKLTCEATLDNIRDFNLHHLTKELTAHSKKRWNFDAELAQREIEEQILDLCDVDSVDDLAQNERELYAELMSATINWDLHEHFKMAIFSIYEHTSVSWFDGEFATLISEFGCRLPNSLIAYWLGLKMIIEEMDAVNEQTA